MYLPTLNKRTERFDLNNAESRAEYNLLKNNPAITIVNETLVSQEESHFEKDYSTKETHHVILVEVEECGL